MKDLAEAFTILWLRANRTSHAVQAFLRCKSCGYDGTDLKVPMKVGHEFRCPGCITANLADRKFYKIVSIIPFEVEPYRVE